MIDHQAGGVELGRHVGKISLDELMLADRLPERLALVPVSQRRIEGRLRDADDERAAGDAPAFQGHQRLPVSLAHFPEQVSPGNAAILEGETAGGGAAGSKLSLDLAYLVARR